MYIKNRCLKHICCYVISIVSIYEFTYLLVTAWPKIGRHETRVNTLIKSCHVCVRKINTRRRPKDYLSNSMCPTFWKTYLDPMHWLPYQRCIVHIVSINSNHVCVFENLNVGLILAALQNIANTDFNVLLIVEYFFFYLLI